MPRKDAGGGPISAQAQQDLVSEGIENFELPKSLVTKIAKSAMPENSKLQKETVLSLVKGSTVFINYLAATAHDVALSKQHKSISASDVLKALEMIEFGDLVEMLQNELQIYRDNSKGDKGRKSGAASSSHKGKAKESESASTVSKSKGKEKATNLPPPFTFAPRAAAASSASLADVHSTGVADTDIAHEVDEEMGEPGEEDEDEEEEEEVEEEVDDEGLVDMMAIEGEEQRRDAAELEEPRNLPTED
ncbi:histone-fold-containing protein [Rhizopogon vinicolor AM-OR11-026]|uniref:DNA polymerase epsilon subunit D n=1 Tax=Rhizopogon vinicolor AM-OR11-026 TaxID=1314800 RepID=A0A1B7N566_9AGAM|nr:histone-fold-containing protein [Rhizopogon vinicolor AM-OR11-026]